MDSLSRIVYNNLQWIDVPHKGREEYEFIKKGFSFSDIDIDECFKDTKHSEIFIRKDYIYFEMLFPVYDRKTQLINHAEINFFIKNNTILTVHNNELLPFINLFNSIEIKEELKKQLFQDNPIILLSGILKHLVDSCFPMLNHVDEDVLNLEKSIFTSKEKSNTETILRIRWNIINFRRIIQSHKYVIEKIIQNGEHLFSMSKLKIYYQDLIEKTKDMWLILENEKESIGALQQTNESLISFQLNDIMKTLALISAVMMPPAFITSLFGVNAKIPLVNHPAAFFVILISCIFLIMFFIFYFKKRKWL